MKTLFISDLHLQASEPQITKAFFEFLKTHAVSADQLFILGDFFEVWIGDDDHSDFNASIISALKTLRDKNTDTFLMQGNRDFLMGKEFARAAGCTLIQDPFPLKLGGKSIILMHGDTLCTDDTEYLEFRAKVRGQEWQQEFLAKPLLERKEIALELREKSKSMGAQKAEDIMDVADQAVSEALENYDLLIHGHTHRPKVHDLIVQGRPAQRWVLGAWHKQGWYIEAQGDSLSLNSFEI